VKIATPNEPATPTGCDKTVLTNAGGDRAKNTVYIIRTPLINKSDLRTYILFVYEEL
jgi:hypothetical protein